jgi:phosphopantetheine adenylyltransferase
MFIWCAVMFALGIFAFLDSLFNYGEIFRQINSVLFMFISLGLLVRTTTKMKARKIENYETRIENLEMQLRSIKKETENSQADY